MSIHYLNRKAPLHRAKHVLCCAAFALLLQSTQALAQVDELPVTVQIKNETNINTKGLEFSPTFYEDGIVFISTNNAGLTKTMDDYLKLPAMSIHCGVLRHGRDHDAVLERGAAHGIRRKHRRATRSRPRRSGRRCR